jgi:hypothetical protein
VPAADDGCECKTPGCCTTTGGCAVTHKNCVGTGAECGSGATAIGQDYWLPSDYCAALGVPGTDSTYSQAMAAAAAAAALQPPAGSCSSPPCLGTDTCGTGKSAKDVYYDDLTDTGGPCFVWAFKTTTANGATTPSGHVHIDPLGCFCPSSSDQTWD